MSYEVGEPILNGPFEEPQQHWFISPGTEPERRAHRRPSIVYEPPGEGQRWDVAENDPYLRRIRDYPGAYELALVNDIRERMKRWRSERWQGVSRITRHLLEHWNDPNRDQQIFFAQREGAEATIFLVEARGDYRQGLRIPLDEPSPERQGEGYRAFTRYACKMATGSGKTTVMGMLAAWSILNKVTDRSDARFSDVILVVCPNLTIRSRLQELDPLRGDASIYTTRDLVPKELRPLLRHGRVIITNWHTFERKQSALGEPARVTKAGVRETVRETLYIGERTTTARNQRYTTLDAYLALVAGGQIRVLSEDRDESGRLRKAIVEAERWVESETSLVRRVLGSGSSRVMVFNDEAHHAYRIPPDEPDEDESAEEREERELLEHDRAEATVWMDGLDSIHRVRGINLCVDLSATPFYLSRVGHNGSRPFPWIVSDFGLTDAIESGLVKIPQLAVRDTTGRAIPGFRNVWDWVLDNLTPRERGGTRASPNPEAVLRHAALPIQMLGSLWSEELKAPRDDRRPPVFIIVCKNTRISKVVYEWLALDQPPGNLPRVGVLGFKNEKGHVATVRIDTKVVEESESEESQELEGRWMRFILDTVGKTHWPTDSQGRPIYPDGFLEVAEKLAKTQDEIAYPPGRDIRCIVSVGMLTEGWDCNTVTHVLGLRPFQSQLLCEQVVGRALRRRSYEIDPVTKRLPEEVATVFGVPFEIVPFKATNAPAPPQPKRWRVMALPERQDLEIRFPRVTGYTRAIRGRVTVNWKTLPEVVIEPRDLPVEVVVTSMVLDATGRLVPQEGEKLTLDAFRKGKRLQALAFELAEHLTRFYRNQPGLEIPAHVLFPQLLAITERFLKQKVRAVAPAEPIDVWLPVVYRKVFETIQSHIQPDVEGGESPEIPIYEDVRKPGSTSNVDFWTRKDVRATKHSHVNYVVCDSSWEAAAVPILERSPLVAAYVKNDHLGLAMRYLHEGQDHDYIPDFLIRLAGEPTTHLILEIKGHDAVKDWKVAAAGRWVDAVNAEGSFGRWYYALVTDREMIGPVLEAVHAARGEAPYVFGGELAEMSA